MTQRDRSKLIRDFAAAMALFVLLTVFAGLVRAQAVPATDPIPRVAFPMSPLGNTVKVGVATVDAANAAKFSFGVAANGGVFAQTGSSMPTPGGASVPITVRSTVPRALAAAAIGRFLGKTIPLINTAAAVYQLGQELGYVINNSSGTPTFSKTGAGVEYALSGGFGPWLDTKEALAPWYCANYSTIKDCGYVDDGFTGRVQFTWVVDNTGGYTTIDSRDVGTVTTSRTRQQFVDDIAAKSTWPSSSALARTLVDAIRAGESIPLTPDLVTGPSTSPGSQSVKVDPVAGTTTTINTTHSHSYAGDTITTSTITNTTIVNNTTGASTTATQTDTPALPDQPKPCGLPDTPACKIDETGTLDPVAADKYDKGAKDYKAAVDANRVIIAGTADKPFFAGWDVFFHGPAMATCAPIALPNSIGEINPCPVVDGVRYIMGLLWAAGGLYLCLGMIKRSV